MNALATLIATHTSTFPVTSRYYGIATVQWTQADGSEVSYVQRRFIPSPDRFDLLVEHTVAPGERLDTITATYLNDPLQFWRICDANGAMDPNDLTQTPGNTIRITMPEGVPGAGSA
jgi:hypothetical protein